MFGAGTAVVPVRGRARDRQPQRQSEQRPKSAGWGTTCTGAHGEARGRGWEERVPGAPSARALPPPPVWAPPGGRARCSEAAHGQEESLPDTAGALAEQCEECPRGARVVALSRPAPPPPRPPPPPPPPNGACAPGRPRPVPPPLLPRPPAKRGRHGNGITGAECCLFSAECQEIRPGGCQAHLPGVGGGRGRREGGPARPGLLGGRESFVTGGRGSLTPPRGRCSGSTDPFQGRSGSSFLVPEETKSSSRPTESSPPPPLHPPHSLSSDPVLGVQQPPASQSLIHSFVCSLSKYLSNTSRVPGD